MAESKVPVVRGERGELERRPRRPAELIRSPFAMMRRMMEDMDRMFDDFTLGRLGSMSMPRSMFSPDIEVLEQGGNLLVRADLPGLSKDDVRVEVTGDELVVAGERKHEEEKTEGGVYHSERSYGSFERRIPLPRGVDASRCDASFESGVLEIKLPLPKEQKRAIDIKAGGGQPAKQMQQQQAPQSPQSRH
jgi:HSP20 family protein